MADTSEERHLTLIPGDAGFVDTASVESAAGYIDQLRVRVEGIARQLKAVVVNGQAVVEFVESRDIVEPVKGLDEVRGLGESSDELAQGVIALASLVVGLAGKSLQEIAVDDSGTDADESPEEPQADADTSGGADDTDSVVDDSGAQEPVEPEPDTEPDEDDSSKDDKDSSGSEQEPDLDDLATIMLPSELQGEATLNLKILLGEKIYGLDVDDDTKKLISSNPDVPIVGVTPNGKTLAIRAFDDKGEAVVDDKGEQETYRISFPPENVTRAINIYIGLLRLYMAGIEPEIGKSDFAHTFVGSEPFSGMTPFKRTNALVTSRLGLPELFGNNGKPTVQLKYLIENLVVFVKLPEDIEDDEVKED